jgi:hypothetical protein
LTATDQPFWAAKSAVAAPMPRLAPVIKRTGLMLCLLNAGMKKVFYAP